MGIHDPRLARLTGIPVFLYLFDLLEFDGHDLTGLPLRERKRAAAPGLRLPRPGPLHAAPQRARRGVLPRGLREGLGGADRQARREPYVHGRSGDWLKLKCSLEQELVIGGFTPPQGSRKRFGALLVGYYEGGELRYAGKVGTGFERTDAGRARRQAGGTGDAGVALHRRQRPAARRPLGRAASWSASSASASGPATASCATPLRRPAHDEVRALAWPESAHFPER